MPTPPVPMGKMSHPVPKILAKSELGIIGEKGDMVGQNQDGIRRTVRGAHVKSYVGNPSGPKSSMTVNDAGTGTNSSGRNSYFASKDQEEENEDKKGQAFDFSPEDSLFLGLKKMKTALSSTVSEAQISAQWFYELSKNFVYAFLPHILPTFVNRHELN